MLFNTEIEGVVPGPVANLRSLELLFVSAPDIKRLNRPIILSTMSPKKQVFADSPYSRTQEERDPPAWTGSLEGMDPSQKAAASSFETATYSDSYNAGPLELTGQASKP